MPSSCYDLWGNPTPRQVHFLFVINWLNAVSWKPKWWELSVFFVLYLDGYERLGPWNLIYIPLFPGIIIHLFILGFVFVFPLFFFFLFFCSNFLLFCYYSLSDFEMIWCRGQHDPHRCTDEMEPEGKQFHIELWQDPKKYPGWNGLSIKSWDQAGFWAWSIMHACFITCVLLAPLFFYFTSTY